MSKRTVTFGVSSADEPIDDTLVVDPGSLVQKVSADVEETVAESTVSRTTVKEKILPTFFSFLLSYFAVDSLYKYSNQFILWIFVFVLLLGILTIVKYAVDTLLFSKEEVNDVDYMAIQSFFFLNRIIVFITTKLIVDLLSFTIAVTEMRWYIALILLATIFFYIFVIFEKIVVVS